ncbi:SDR family oxidoreductase [Kosakonia sacchari]|nr:SDR family oxidoreductase [Kosakonia sacchari]
MQSGQSRDLSGSVQEALQSKIKDLAPSGRMGTPTALAKAALFLASDESAYVVGTELLVDGGTVAICK